MQRRSSFSVPGLGIGSGRQQQSADIGIGGEMQRRAPFLVASLGIGSGLQQHAADIGVAGEMQRRAPFLVAGLGIGSGLQQHAADIGVACEVQRRAPFLVAGLGIGSGLQQQTADVSVGRVVERRFAIVVDVLGIKPRPEEQGNGLGFFEAVQQRVALLIPNLGIDTGLNQEPQHLGRHEWLKPELRAESGLGSGVQQQLDGIGHVAVHRYIEGCDTVVARGIGIGPGVQQQAYELGAVGGHARQGQRRHADPLQGVDINAPRVDEGFGEPKISIAHCQMQSRIAVPADDGRVCAQLEQKQRRVVALHRRCHVQGCQSAARKRAYTPRLARLCVDIRAFAHELPYRRRIVVQSCEVQGCSPALANQSLKLFHDGFVFTPRHVFI